jgi:hypothetical protein
MPVTARFSSRFYERLGDEVAQELVNWFNTVNQDYRDQLTVTNGRNWLAFEAKLDASIADVRADLRGSIAELRAELIKWMFGFWIAFWLATVIPLGGLILSR